MDRCKVLEMAEIPVKNVDIGFLNEAAVEDSDIIVHLAAWAGVRHSLEQPNIYTKNNI